MRQKMKEVAKKYLLKDSILSLIEAHDLYGHKILQFYTTIKPEKEVCYRQLDDHYFKTVTYGTDASRGEEETEISEKKFQKKFKERIKEPIKKTRYIFELEEKEYSIEVFKKDLKDLYLLEIEFPTREAFEAFELPPLLKAHVIKEVSFEESYKSKNIILHGKPQTDYDPDAFFTELDNKKIDELESYFIPNLSSLDALRVILYKYALSILFYKKRILLHNDPEDLHQFRVNIRKSRAFLKEFAFLFPEKQYLHFYETLKSFATQTNQKRDLDVIKENLGKLTQKHSSIQKDIKQQRTDEQQHIREMLESQPFEDFFLAYQQALKDTTCLSHDNKQKMIEESARKVIKKLHSRIVKKIVTLEKSYSDNELHKIRISLKKLRYLLEEFQHIFGEKKIRRMIEKSKKLQTLLGDFNDTLNQATLIHSYIASNVKNFSEGKELEDKLLGETSKAKKKLLRKAIKELHSFKKNAFEL